MSLPKITREDLEHLNYRINCLKKQITNSTAAFDKVDTYNDLPLAVDNNDVFIYVKESQGTWWLPGSAGGNYYSKGFYYSNGVQWIYAGEISFQASQSDTDAGTINDQFVTPLTLKNSSQWTTKANTTHSHAISDVTGLQSVLDTKLETVPVEYITELELMVELDLKQDTLISGTNIKTINGESLLGSGDIIITSGSSDINIDGGSASSIYTLEQNINGGNA